MSTIKILLPLAILSLSLGCSEAPHIEEPNEAFAVQVSNSEQVSQPIITKTGKFENAEKLKEIYTKSNLNGIHFPKINEDILLALKRQLKVLELKRSKAPQRIGSLEVTIEKLEETIQTLIDNANLPPDFLANLVETHQIWGNDRMGHVKFTGYYSPVLNVKSTPDEKYKFPIYAKPTDWSGKLPTRTQIDGEGVLEGMGLELAYAESLADIYYLQLQGSGYVKFLDTGKKQLLRFAGGNGYKYRSIEKYIMKNEDIKLSNLSVDGIKSYLRNNPEMEERILFSNPSYAFFKLANTRVRGSAGVTLMDDISIAVDPDYIPIGSVLLASIPAYDKKGNFTHHEYKLLMAQDVGGAINGTGHVDVYSGVGKKGKNNASRRHHYGQLWLLTKKNYGQLAMK